MVVPEILQSYQQKGFQLVFYDTKTKAPKDKDWPTRDYPPEAYKPGQNVGVKLGTEIQPGKFLVDIDFDWSGGLIFAKRLIPPAGFGFGRATKPISHAFFTSSTPLPSYKYFDIDDLDEKGKKKAAGPCLVELRGTNKDGTIGHQTMVPPSIHPSDEPLQLKVDEGISHCDEIANRIRLYAIACILYKHLGQRGLLHDVRLSLAGFLLRLGVHEDDCILLGQAVAEATGNSIDDVAATVRTTFANLKAGKRVLGGPSLAISMGEAGKAVVKRISEWLGVVDKDFLYNEKGVILANHQENIRRAAEKLHVTFAFNQFAVKPLMSYNGYHGPIEDNVAKRMWFDIQDTFRFKPPKEFFFDVINDLAYCNLYHPVRDYLGTIQWDGIPRLDTWLLRLGKVVVSAEHRQHEDYVRAISSLPIIAVIRRVRSYPRPTKFDELLVFESGQGLNKSSALRALCPREEWFSDDLPLNVDSQKVIERTGGKLIIEASEMSGYGKRDSEHFKSFISRQVDGPVRLAYAKMPVEVARQFVIIGTTNSDTYLNDDTGNRRVWPIRVGQFDVEGILAERDQLWAEASAREMAGESIRLSPDLYGMAGIQQERRRIMDDWEPLIAGQFQPPCPQVRVTNTGLYTKILHLSTDKRGPAQARRLAQIMQRLGFRDVAVRNGGDVSRGWGREAIGEGMSDELTIRDKDLPRLFEEE
jgi:hypothetical protein